MIKKITQNEILLLKKGDIIVKYPLDGEAVNEVEVNNLTQLLIMKIEKIDDKNVMLGFEVPDIPIFIGSMKGNRGYHLHKEKDEMVIENKWWLYQDETLPKKPA